ncbi:hypothetical protein SLEP1_g37067 [Rubroshorea leprosula]|uniref:Uncharacterized protein n=1 Tax=Rubroshorea leprosula TaxID=152421 RepID=A0AAV5KTG4_9ROSI|nr:hypothetical protein SLEP1_g37067 [Rubroshorea leprosula]
MDFDSVSGLLFLQVTQHQTICSLHHHCNPSFVCKVSLQGPDLQIGEGGGDDNAITIPLISDFSFHILFFKEAVQEGRRRDFWRWSPASDCNQLVRHPLHATNSSGIRCNQLVQHPAATNSSGIRLQPLSC